MEAGSVKQMLLKWKLKRMLLKWKRERCRESSSNGSRIFYEIYIIFCNELFAMNSPFVKDNIYKLVLESQKVKYRWYIGCFSLTNGLLYSKSKKSYLRLVFVHMSHNCYSSFHSLKAFSFPRVQRLQIV